MTRLSTMVRKYKLLLFIILFVSFSVLHAQEPVSVGRSHNGVIGKHDVVNYHESGLATKGDAKFVFQWKGADWFFANKEHRDAFASNPEKYAPAYNGFCSNALSLGKGLVRTNGKVWHIWNDRLHTFYAKGGKKRWLKNDYSEMVAAADKAWQEELQKFAK